MRPVLLASLTPELPFQREYRIGYAEGADPTLRPWVVPAVTSGVKPVPRVLVLGASAGSFLLGLHELWAPEVPEDMRCIDVRDAAEPCWWYLRGPELELYGLAFATADRAIASLTEIDAAVLLPQGDADEASPIARLAATLGLETRVAVCGTWPRGVGAHLFARVVEFPVSPESLPRVIEAIR